MLTRTASEIQDRYDALLQRFWERHEDVVIKHSSMVGVRREFARQTKLGNYIWRRFRREWDPVVHAEHAGEDHAWCNGCHAEYMAHHPLLNTPP